MANALTRLLGFKTEERAASSPHIPSRSDIVVTPEKALGLTSVQRAIAIIGTACSKLDQETWRYATGIEAEIENPLLVNRPCLDLTRREFIYGYVTDMALYGNAYWLKQYSSNGSVNNLIPLPAKHVIVSKVNPTDIFGPVQYQYKNTIYTADQIKHVRYMPRVGEVMGRGPIELCKADIKAALDLRNYAANWFGQAGVPTGVLKTNAQISPDDADRITAKWTEKQEKRQLAVLGNGFDYQNIALSPKDALMTDVERQMDQKIARMLGIPPRLLATGIDGTSDTYANLQDEDATFIRYTLMGYLDPYEDAMSDLLPRGQRIKIDYDSLFKADTQTRYNYYKTGIDAGFLTVPLVQQEEGIDVGAGNTSL